VSAKEAASAGESSLGWQGIQRRDVAETHDEDSRDRAIFKSR